MQLQVKTPMVYSPSALVRWTQAMNLALQPFGLDLESYAILESLATTEADRPEQLQELLMLEQERLNRQVGHLLVNSLVQKQGSTLVATDAGKAVANAAKCLLSETLLKMD
jgi:hypothetical protein